MAPEQPLCWKFFNNILLPSFFLKSEIFLRTSKQNNLILTCKDAHLRHLADANQSKEFLVDTHKKLPCQRIQST